MEQRLPIFLNPHAGRGAEAEGEVLVQAFRAAGAHPFIHAVPGNELEKSIRREVANGAPVIGAAGGDGTISAAANAMVGSQAILLPIPMGTLNHFSKRYNITSVEDAVLAWQAQNVVAVHTGCVNDRIFINNASCGFYPHVVRHRDAMERWLPRVPAMWIAGFRVLAALPMMRLRVSMDGRDERIRTAALWVGIGRNSLRFPEIGDAEKQENAVLEIVTARAETRIAILRLAGRLLWHLKKRLEPQARNLAVWRAAEFTLESHHRIDIALDGEALRLRGPLEFRVRREELRVLSLVNPPKL